MWINQNGSNVTLDGKKVILYGVTDLAKKLLHKGEFERCEIICFADSDPRKQGKSYSGIKICSLAELNRIDDDVIFATTLLHFSDKLQRIVGNNMVASYFDEKLMRDISLFSDLWRDVVKKFKYSQYKYVHIIPPSVFVRNVYTIIKNEFDVTEHLFIVWVRDSFDLDDFGISEFVKQSVNTIIIPEIYYRYYMIRQGFEVVDRSILKRILDRSTRIVFHSSIWDVWLTSFLKDGINDFCDKCVFVSMGADLSLDASDDRIKMLKTINRGYVEDQFLERFRRITDDCLELRTTQSSFYTYLPIKLKQCPQNSNSSVNILLGHSANGVNHLLGIELIKKLKFKNFRVYCPLTYGSYETMKTTSTIGKKAFGERFIPIFNTVETDAYFSFLSTMDLAVMTMSATTAAKTTIRYLNVLDIKVYTDNDYYHDNSDELIIEPIDNLICIDKHEIKKRKDYGMINGRIENHNLEAVSFMNEVLS